MLRRIRIEHYKSISDLRLNLENIAVLVGSNSTGKSNFIDAIAFLRDCVVHGLDYGVSERHGIDSIIQWSPTRPYNLDIEAVYETDRGEGHYALKLSSKSRQPTILEESGSWRDKQDAKIISFSRTKNEIQFVNVDHGDRRDADRLSRIKVDEDLFIRTLRVFPAFEMRGFSQLYRAIGDFKTYNIYPNIIRSPQKSSNETVLSGSGDNLDSVLKQMVSSKSSSTKARYQEIISSMAKLIPNLERVLVKNVSGLLWPVFEVQEGRRGHQFNVSQISDGALRILGILTALYQPHPPRVIAIEEPEQNIHPGALSLLSEAFKDMSSRIQIITTTHSPHMLDHFDVKNIYATEYSENHTIIGPISKQQKKVISERLLSASELMTSQGFELDL
jgi:predicted ATPase